MEFPRPGFVSELAWSQASEDAKHDWNNYAVSLRELAADPKFRLVLGVWLDDFCRVGANSFDVERYAAGLPQDPVTLGWLEGARTVGIRITAHLQSVAPKMFMRGLYEMTNARKRPDPMPAEDRPKEE